MGDPVQQKIMLFLPVVFTFIFLNFPSGLVIYWVVNNVLSIGQQWYIYKQADKETAKKATVVKEEKKEVKDKDKKPQIKGETETVQKKKFTKKKAGRHRKKKR